ncbi:hypothetical protein QZH41_002269 [Actinostola sp. cb2023]|nr:hypothetical protein QZH41_002269 [Actinostola sp. cb2023]
MQIKPESSIKDGKFNIVVNNIPKSFNESKMQLIFDYPYGQKISKKIKLLIVQPAEQTTLAPPVIAGLFKTLSIGFGVLSLVLLLIVAGMGLYMYPRSRNNGHYQVNAWIGERVPLEELEEGEDNANDKPFAG